jgi:hypothetical protein
MNDLVIDLPNETIKSIKNLLSNIFRKQLSSISSSSITTSAAIASKSITIPRDIPAKYVNIYRDQEKYFSQFIQSIRDGNIDQDKIKYFFPSFSQDPFLQIYEYINNEFALINTLQIIKIINEKIAENISIISPNNYVFLNIIYTYLTILELTNSTYYEIYKIFYENLFNEQPDNIQREINKNNTIIIDEFQKFIEPLSRNTQSKLYSLYQKYNENRRMNEISVEEEFTPPPNIETIKSAIQQTLSSIETSISAEEQINEPLSAVEISPQQIAESAAIVNEVVAESQSEQVIEEAKENGNPISPKIPQEETLPQGEDILELEEEKIENERISVNDNNILDYRYFIIYLLLKFFCYKYDDLNNPLTKTNFDKLNKNNNNNICLENIDIFGNNKFNQKLYGILKIFKIENVSKTTRSPTLREEEVPSAVEPNVSPTVETGAEEQLITKVTGKKKQSQQPEQINSYLFMIKNIEKLISIVTKSFISKKQTIYIKLREILQKYNIHLEIVQEDRTRLVTFKIKLSYYNPLTASINNVMNLRGAIKELEKLIKDPTSTISNVLQNKLYKHYEERKELNDTFFENEENVKELLFKIVKYTITRYNMNKREIKKEINDIILQKSTIGQESILKEIPMENLLDYINIIENDPELSTKIDSKTLLEIQNIKNKHMKDINELLKKSNKYDLKFSFNHLLYTDFIKYNYIIPSIILICQDHYFKYIVNTYAENFEKVLNSSTLKLNYIELKNATFKIEIIQYIDFVLKLRKKLCKYITKTELTIKDFYNKLPNLNKYIFYINDPYEYTTYKDIYNLVINNIKLKTVPSQEPNGPPQIIPVESGEILPFQVRYGVIIEDNIHLINRIDKKKYDKNLKELNMIDSSPVSLSIKKNKIINKNNFKQKTIVENLCSLIFEKMYELFEVQQIDKPYILSYEYNQKDIYEYFNKYYSFIYTDDFNEISLWKLLYHYIKKINDDYIETIKSNTSINTPQIIYNYITGKIILFNITDENEKISKQHYQRAYDIINKKIEFYENTKKQEKIQQIKNMFEKAKIKSGVSYASIASAGLDIKQAEDVLSVSELIALEYLKKEASTNIKKMSITYSGLLFNKDIKMNILNKIIDELQELYYINIEQKIKQNKQSKIILTENDKQNVYVNKQKVFLIVNTYYDIRDYPPGDNLQDLLMNMMIEFINPSIIRIDTLSSNQKTKLEITYDDSLKRFTYKPNVLQQKMINAESIYSIAYQSQGDIITLTDYLSIPILELEISNIKKRMQQLIKTNKDVSELQEEIIQKQTSLDQLKKKSKPQKSIRSFRKGGSINNEEKLNKIKQIIQTLDPMKIKNIRDYYHYLHIYHLLKKK